MNKDQEEKPTTGWFVMRWILPLFAVMFVVNGIFVWFAFTTHTGNQTDNAYDEGINYNQVLEQARLKEQLGWQVGIEVDQGLITVSLFDKAGNLINDVDMDVMLFDPRSADNDKTLVPEEVSSGQFLIAYPHDVKGHWELRLIVQKEGDRVEYRRKLVLP